MDFEQILQAPIYQFEKVDKEQLLLERLKFLTNHHYSSCELYKKMLDCTGYDPNNIFRLDDLPFLPVRLFKEMELKSVADDEVVKTMTSSGTSGQNVSKIYLDKKTASNQQKVMVKIVSNYIGSCRVPMIIIDSPSVIKNRDLFSARGAGILGFSMFGTDKMYALKDDMTLDIDALDSFLTKHKDETILLFGFTFMIWKHFYQELLRIQDVKTFDLSNGVLIHGGGWKKLISESVTETVFHAKLEKICNLKRIHDYYGMVEQTGCIYMECEYGHLHASIFSDLIVRRPLDFSVCDNGEEGIIQVLSTIPESYPGHSLLTEDMGIVLGEDDCPCGRKGKYFKITGRMKNAELRGCSDTYATKFN